MEDLEGKTDVQTASTTPEDVSLGHGPLFGIIFASDPNGGFGKAGRLPWNLPSELDYFRTATTGAAVIMGRNTFSSLRKPLKERLNIVVTSGIGDEPIELLYPAINTQKAARPDGSAPLKKHPTRVILVSSLSEAKRVSREAGVSKAFAIGGLGIIIEALSDREFKVLQWTRVGVVVPDCDVFLPEFDLSGWLLLGQLVQTPSPRDEGPYEIFSYIRPPAAT